MTIDFLMPLLLHQFKSEHDLIKAIEEISLKFTRNRESINDYLNDPRLVSAYTVFYLLTNIPKLEEVLKWMPSEWIRELKDCDFIDLGSGPGTFSIAWKNLGGNADFYQVELSKLMKEQGQKIWNGLFSERLIQSSSWSYQTERKKFLLFGHSANEMGSQVALDYIRKINPDHILFIEPGTKDFFPEMLSLRKSLIEMNYNVLYPCPQPLQCPMQGTEDWCHQFIQIKHDPEVERLSQMARKDRKLLPLTVQAFSKTFTYKRPEERLVRVLNETKFSHEWEVCHNNQLERYQIMKRDLSKKDSKEVGLILAGLAMETETLKTVENTKRVKINKII